ncbi:MAG: hypothetical protein IJ002_03865 [Clostridia bacterium]|nr:hypothetical protein [Clostridia bacterium]
MSRIITSIILLMTMGFCGCGLSRRNSDNIDGGVKTYNSGEDSPKVIESTEIISFEFEVSLYTIVLEEESELDGRNYKLSAVLEDGAVKSKIKWRDRAGAGEEHDFTADASFMTSLQEIISKYDFAQYNGYISKASGLPDMYGAKIDINYASSERIYAHDNQDCFISIDAIKELIELFNITEKVQAGNA